VRLDGRSEAAQPAAAAAFAVAQPDTAAVAFAVAAFAQGNANVYI
jgi:hypothetical protein